MRRLSVSPVGSFGSNHYEFQCECGGTTEFDFFGSMEDASKLAEQRCESSCYDDDEGGD